MLAGVIGGEPMLGFIAAVAFATILAVVAGLTLSGASALSHDLWVNVVRHGEAPESEQLKVARVATLLFGIAAVAAGHRLQDNERGLHGRPGFRHRGEREFPGAFPLDLLAATSPPPARSPACGPGALTAVGLIMLSPAVWVDVLKQSGRRSSRSRVRAW